MMMHEWFDDFQFNGGVCISHVYVDTQLLNDNYDSMIFSDYGGA